MSPESLEQIRQVHNARLQGRLDVAETICRGIVAREKAESALWQLLGEICHDRGAFVDAEAAFRQVLLLKPDSIDAHVSLGFALFQLNRLDPAIHAFEHALRLKPNHANAHFHLGNAWSARDNLGKAIAHLQQAAQLDRTHVDALINLGIAFAQIGQTPTAVECLRQAIALRPESAKAHHNLGVALAQQYRYPEAEESIRTALRIQPDYADAFYNLGNILVEQRKQSEAVWNFRWALEQKPDHVDALNNLGLALKDLGRLEESVVMLRQAVHLNPNNRQALNNLGLSLGELNRFDEAERCFLDSLRIDPRNDEAHTNLGSLYKDQGRSDAALAEFQIALWLNPKNPSTHWNRALTWLQHGNFRDGWQEYEWRFQRKNAVVRPFDQPRWDGGDLHGKTILVHMEQGLGDMIQFVRFAQVLKSRGARVLWETPPYLVPLFHSVPGIDKIVPEGTTAPAFDVHAPLLSLPLLLNLPLDAIPAPIPYLVPHPDLVERWSAFLNRFAGFKVGLCWQGNIHHAQDRHRSMPLKALTPLASIPDINLVSLQKGPGAEQLELCPQIPIHSLGDDWDATSGPFMDTAAILAKLDLVITVDTVTAHLAGALGIKTWVLLPTRSDWRWLTSRDDSPWYPTIRLFRQSHAGKWDDVIATVTAELQVAARAGFPKSSIGKP